MLITKELSKAARALAAVTVDQLAQSSGMKADTLRSFESGRTKTLTAGNQEALRLALDKLGVQFIPENGGGAGVRLRDPSTQDDSGEIVGRE